MRSAVCPSRGRQFHEVLSGVPDAGEEAGRPQQAGAGSPQGGEPGGQPAAIAQVTSRQQATAASGQER